MQLSMATNVLPFRAVIVVCHVGGLLIEVD